MTELNVPKMGCPACRSNRIRVEAEPVFLANGTGTINVTCEDCKAWIQIVLESGMEPANSERFKYLMA